MQTAAKLKEMASERPHLAGGAVPQQAATNIGYYLNWIRTSEPFLKYTFIHPDISLHLQSPAYRAIRNTTAYVNELIESELQEQASWLSWLASQVELLLQRLTAAPGVPTLLDTNVLLHACRRRSPDRLRSCGACAHVARGKLGRDCGDFD